MAATKTVYQVQQPYNSTVPRHGVLTLFGYGIQARVDRGHLLVEDGIGAERRHFRFARVGHGLKRLVIIGSDGMISLAALRWLSDQQAAFIMLERDGKVLAVTGPVRPSDARLRRAQALAQQSRAALEIGKELIQAKLIGQESLVRNKLQNSTTADAIARFRDRLPTADTLGLIRTLEAQAAAAYWSAWGTLPITFPRQDMRRMPEHWRTFGTRKSPLTGSPRLAVTPPGAILNYCYALLESESRLAAATLGLDPGIGMLHVDTPNRDSLACDLMEPVRPAVDAWLLDWITQEPFRRSDFFETVTGNCRLMSSLCRRLSEAATVWGKMVAPWAERVASLLWASASRSTKPSLHTLATRLTQAHRREAKGAPALKVEAPKPDTLCRGCGKQIPRGKRYCQQCAVPLTRHNFDAGRKMAHSPESRAQRSETQRRQQAANRAFNPSELPTWLTREFYTSRIAPALANVPKPRIRSALGVSEPHAVRIQRGTVPHPRHWLALAQLVGINSPSAGVPPEPMQ